MGSYGFNGWMYNDFAVNANPTYSNDPNNVNLYYRTMTSIRPSSSTPMFFDCTWVDAQPQIWLEGGNNDPTPANLTGLAPGGAFAASMTQRVCLNRHQMAINAVMADGSGQHIPLANLHRVQWFNTETATNFNPPLPSK